VYTLPHRTVTLPAGRRLCMTSPGLSPASPVIVLPPAFLDRPAGALRTRKDVAAQQPATPEAARLSLPAPAVPRRAPPPDTGGGGPASTPSGRSKARTASGRASACASSTSRGRRRWPTAPSSPRPAGASAPCPCRPCGCPPCGSRG
jgi:hypothetical protein